MFGYSSNRFFLVLKFKNVFVVHNLVYFPNKSYTSVSMMKAIWIAKFRI